MLTKSVCYFPYMRTCLNVRLVPVLDACSKYGLVLRINVFPASYWRVTREEGFFKGEQNNNLPGTNEYLANSRVSSSNSCYLCCISDYVLIILCIYTYLACTEPHFVAEQHNKALVHGSTAVRGKHTCA